MALAQCIEWRHRIQRRGLFGGFSGGGKSGLFWNIGTTDQMYACGSGNCLPQFTHGITTAEMQNPFTFINGGWDFATVWGKSTTGANNGYLQLRALSTGLYDDYATVTSANLTKTYGNANPALTYAIGGLGLVNGDTLSGGLATVASATSGVGAYAITQGTLVASPNYAITYTGALLTVAPAQTNRSTGGTDTGSGSGVGTGTGTTIPGGTSNAGTGTTTPGGSANPGTSTPVTGTPTITFRLPPSIFATALGSTPFSPPGGQSPGSNAGGQDGLGDFTSPGYDKPSTCVAGRACGS